MAFFKRPFELRNIKNNPDGYQIQFIVDGKSHSAFEKDLEKAKKIRDKMEKKLKVVPRGVFRRKPSPYKLSYIPGTDKPMPPGLTIRTTRRHGTDTFEVVVNWRDHTGKFRIKTFYGCSDSCYKLVKMRSAYERALAFRKAFEKAVLDGTLKDFDPTAFNQRKARKLSGSEKNTTTISKLRTKKRIKQRTKSRAKRR